MKKKILIPLLSALLLLAMTLTSLGATPTIQNDDGTGSAFRALPVNYVKIDSLDLTKASIVSQSSNGTYSFSRGAFSAQDPSGSWPLLVYTGPLQYGGQYRTATQNASTKANNLGTVTLKFPKCATISDGTKADIIMTLNPVANLSQPRNTTNPAFKNGATSKLLIAASFGNSMTFSVTPPRTTLATNTVANDSTYSGATIGQRIHANIKITKPASGNTVGATVSDPSMLIIFRDFDVPDMLIYGNASASQKYDGYYSEGVEMENGWFSPVALGQKNGPDPANSCLVNAQSVNGNTKIKGNAGPLTRLFDYANITDDTNSYYSGMAAGVNPAGFSFYWTGSVSGVMNSHMGTVIGGQPTVAVWSKRTAGGTLTSSNQGSWKKNTHLMNSKATYSYKPSEGYYVKSLTVDGVPQTLTAEQQKNGGSYVFPKLNKNPIGLRRVYSGQILEASDSSHYEIDVVFQKSPVYKNTKTADHTTIPVDSDEEITYTIHTDETIMDTCAGTYTVHDDLANGLLELVPDSVTVTALHGTYVINQADNDGIDVTFNSEEPGNSLPSMEITYKAKVNWEKYHQSSATKITNTVPGSSWTLSATNDLKLSKKVAGTLRDTTKKFEMTVAMSGLDKNTVYEVNGANKISSIADGTKVSNGFKSSENGKAQFTVKIMGGEEVTFRNLPIGAKYRVVEASSDHRASYKLVSEADSPVFVTAEDANTVNKKELSTAEETLDKQDGIVTIAYTNTKNPKVVTGIIDNSGWVIPAVLIVLAAGGIIIARRRRQAHDEEI